MIKPEELRIGNYVTVNNPKYRPDITGETVKVVGIEMRISKSFPTSSGVIKIEVNINKYPDEFGQFNEFIDPIPLSEEWLLRLGFTLNKYQKQDLFYYSLEVLSHGKISYYPNIKTIELGTTSGYNFGKTEINYVHQLQNLLYSITGEELILKE